MSLPSLTRRQCIIITVFMIVGVFAWSPWLIDSYAISAVIEHLGGPDQEYDYIGEMLLVEDVPQNAVRVPFVAFIYFPGEAISIVTFWG